MNENHMLISPSNCNLKILKNSNIVKIGNVYVVEGKKNIYWPFKIVIVVIKILSFHNFNPHICAIHNEYYT